jgi:hypothetical protein
MVPNAPTPTPCHWWDRTGQVALYLRRYRHGTGCPVSGYHWSMAFVGAADVSDRGDGYLHHGDVPGPDAYQGDPRWPTACQCGEPFTADDPWQVFTQRIYQRRGTDERVTQDGLPVGALYDAAWESHKGPDGISLCVVCPPASAHNVWHADGPAYPPDKSGPKWPAWSRTGDPTTEPPTVTVSPSIEIGFGHRDGKPFAGGPHYYHGHLTNGVLTPG